MTNYEVSTIVLQALLGLAAFGTLLVYYHQLRVMSHQLASMQNSFNAQSTLALVNFLQSAEVRAARHVVRSQLSEKPVESWTESDRASASLVVANYDVAAMLLREGVASVDSITSNWGTSIRHCHTTLAPFINQQRNKTGSDDQYWRNFDWLAEQANKRLASQ